MGNFSRNTFNQLKNYVGVRLQQGVPIVDADWNEQEDIRKHELRSFLKWFVGNGVPKGNDGFRIVPLEGSENDFTIKGGNNGEPGYCLVEGWDALIINDVKYSEQKLPSGADPLGPLFPPLSGERTDTVYLDVWEREVDAQEDENLVNQAIGIETCVRMKREWVVRVAQTAAEPPDPSPGHVYYPLALLKRTANQNAIKQEDLTDLRRTGLALLSEEIAIKDGKVGIGTFEPGKKLDVNGDIRANNFYKLLPHNIISNSFMNRLKGNVPSGFRIGSYYMGNSTINIEAVHPFTKGFEGPYVESKPANAVDHVNDATGSNPYWFGRWHKGPRITHGGMADGWGGRRDGNILKITGKRDTSDNSNPNTVVYVHFAKESRILTKALLFRAWIKIIKGSLHLGTAPYVTPEITRSMTEAAPDGWYFINTIIDSLLHITDLEGAYCFILKCFGEGENHEGDFEIYVALPYLANIEIDDSPHWSPSILDILSDYGTTIDLDSGNLGIGTPNPEGTLHVKAHGNGWDGGLTLTSQDNIGKWRIHPENALDHALMFSDNDSDTRVIFRNGRVGIGTASPGAKLDVVADSQTWWGWYEAIRLGQSANSAITHPGGGLLFGFHSSRVFYFADTINGNYLVTIEAAEGGILWAKRHTGGGHDYAEYFESKNGQEIDPGTAVVLDNGKIRPAKKDEIPIGIISANPGIVGGVHIEWPKKHLRDEFGRVILEEDKEEIMKPKKEKVKKERQKMEKKTVKEEVKRTEVVKIKGKYCQKEITETIEREIEEPVSKEVDLYDAAGKNKIGKHKIPVMETYEEEIDVLDDEGRPVMIGTGKFETRTRPKINPDYDETKEYIPREKRPEWNCVGLLGQLPLRKGQPVAPTWIKIKDISKDVELWLVK